MAAEWITQGGGTAIKNGLDFIFIEAPDWWPDAVGESVPREWDLFPANQEAKDRMSEEEEVDDYEMR